MPLPVTESNVPTRDSDIPRSFAGDDRGRERVLAVDLGGGDQAQQFGLVLTAHRDHVGQRGLPARDRPGLVEHDDVELVRRLQRLGVLDQDAVLRALPVPTMIDSGVASPSAHGQAITRTVTAATTASVSCEPSTNHRTKAVIAMKIAAGTK